MVALTFRERERKKESFFPLNFNIFINLDNKEKARARNKEQRRPRRKLYSGG